jgi:hypothetical protein
MLQMTKTDEYDLWFSQTDRPFSFSTPFSGQDFALLLVVADRAITDDERDAVSKEVVRQGCRYAVCTGHQCSKWDDSIDLAYLATNPDFSPPDEQFVMTTWHEGEPLEDVAHFFRWNTVFDDFIPQHYLILILGGDAGTAQQVRSSIEKWFGPER